MSRHDALRATWSPGQSWETLVEGCPQWVPVGNCGRAQPLWEERQEYRRRQDLEIGVADDAHVRRLWVEAGMPPYLLSKPGTNFGLVRFATLIVEAATQTAEKGSTP